MLNKANGGGEPLNVIISGQSDPEVLTKGGFLDFVGAVGYSEECLGLHKGDPTYANLGDGKGDQLEMMVIRQSIGIPFLGSCIESLTGGNHFRVYQQAGSNALFLAVSKEEDLQQDHNISPDGYNVGRNMFASAAVGSHPALLKNYEVTVTDLPNLLAPGSQGVNHGIAQDGVVKLMTIKIKNWL